MNVIKYTILALGSIFILYFICIFIYRDVRIKKIIYLNKLGEKMEYYYDRDSSEADRHVVVKSSTLIDNKVLSAAIKDCPEEGLEATNGDIILGYKNDKIVSLGLPRRFWAQNCTGHPSIIIPIFVEKYNAVSIKFQDIETLNVMYSSD